MHAVVFSCLLHIPPPAKTTDDWNGYFLFAVVLAMYYDKMSNSLRDWLDMANMVLTIVFAAEMFFKIVGLGLWGYLSDKLNLFDAMVVTISLIELLMPVSEGDSR